MDKIDRLLDAMEHPERYTSPEIENMLRDPEVKDVFDLLDKTKSSLQTIVTPDIEEEWKAFVVNHHNEKPARRFGLTDLFSRKAAASIAVCIMSLTAIAAIVEISVHFLDRKESEIITTKIGTEAKEVTLQPDSVMTFREAVPGSTEIVVFDNELFENIISRIASYYGYDMIYDADKSKSLRLYYRWNQALPIEDIVESLNNFEQIHLTISDRTIRID